MRNEDLLGVPFKWGGCLPDGLDCFTLAVEVRRRCGISTPSFDWVYEQWDRDTLDHNRIADWAEEFRLTGPCPGAFTLGESPRGPAIITTDGTSAFFFSPRLKVAAISPIDLGGAQWRI